MKTKWTEPELLVDSHHGIYSYQLAWQYLSERYKNQAKLSDETIKSLETGPDDEFYFESFDELEQVMFKTETGQRFQIVAREDIWLVPLCYMRTRGFNDFFNN